MDSMRGLILSEKYYRANGQEMIMTKFAAYKNRIAAGLVGLGSECFGFDDAISQDHDWGPGFCLWLDKKDYDLIGLPLQQAYDALPDQFMGFRRLPSQWGNGRVGVTSIDDFYSFFIGSPQLLDAPLHWLKIPEENLAACTNGKVFDDPIGTFTSIRNRIKEYYPEDIRLKKIAAACMAAAQSGQYNYRRCLRRKAFFAAQYALMTFCQKALYLAFLLNRKYMPFYKWATEAAKNLPYPGHAIASSVEILCQEEWPSARQNQIEEICSILIKEIRSQGISHVNSDSLLDHGPIVHSQIQDSTIRQLDILWGGN
jgi:hypothetical protein